MPVTAVLVSTSAPDDDTKRAVLKMHWPLYANLAHPHTLSCRMPRAFQLEHLTLMGLKPGHSRKSAGLHCQVVADGMTLFRQPLPVEFFAEGLTSPAIICTEEWPEDCRVDIRIGSMPYCQIVV